MLEKKKAPTPSIGSVKAGLARWEEPVNSECRGRPQNIHYWHRRLRGKGPRRQSSDVCMASTFSVQAWAISHYRDQLVLQRAVVPTEQHRSITEEYGRKGTP